MYKKYPEFIDTDPRSNRPLELGYSISADMMQARHECMLNPAMLSNKRVLDLGSCVGYTGAWVLEHGAAFYQGVEYSNDFVVLSNNNLDKYFHNTQWSIAQSSFEDFFKVNNEKYDILIASGVIYSVVDPVAFLNNIASIADTCIIESVHPWSRSPRDQLPGLPNDVMQRFRESPYWEGFIESEPFTTLGPRRMVLGTSNNSIEYTGCHVSMGYLKRYMDIIGFTYDQSVYNLLKEKVPEVYNKWHRFATKFDRSSNPLKSNGFIQSITDVPSNVNIKPWTR